MVSDYGGAQPAGFQGSELDRRPASRGVLSQRELPAARGPEVIRATRDLLGSELRRQPQGSWAVPLKHQPSLSQGSELVRNAKGPEGHSLLISLRKHVALTLVGSQMFMRVQR